MHCERSKIIELCLTHNQYASVVVHRLRGDYATQILSAPTISSHEDRIGSHTTCTCCNRGR